MASGIWPAVSGAMAQSHAVETVANNLANADTVGFKKDLPTFKEYMATVEREKLGEPIAPGHIKNRDLYPLDGADTAHVVVDGTYSSFRQGGLRVTQNPLDLALDGKGFFEVSTPAGIRLTKQGSFKVATDGRLVTSQGYPVLASNPGGLASALPAPAVQPSQGRLLTQGRVTAELSPPQPTAEELQARYINLKDVGASISISDAGEIYAGDRRIAQLAVVEPKEPRLLRKTGSALFQNPDPGNIETEQKPTTRVVQGMLEMSNVNPIEEMTNLIKANRMFELDMKAVKTHSELMQKESSEIGKL